LLGIKPYREYYYVYTDHRTQLQYLISGREIAEQGFKINLFGYQYRICLHIKEIYDTTGQYEKLYHLLNGKGVSSIDEALKEMELLPLHSKYENFFSYDNIEKIRTYLVHKPDKKKKEEISLPGKLDTELNSLINEFTNYFNGKKSVDKTDKKFHGDLNSAREFYQVWVAYSTRKNVTKWMKECDNLLPVNSKIETNREYLTFVNLILLKQLFSKKSDNEKIHILFDELLLQKPITNILQQQKNGSSIHQRMELIKVLLSIFIMRKQKSGLKANSKKSAAKVIKKSDEQEFLTSIKSLLADDIINNFIRVNEFEGKTYFNKERFEELTQWILQFNFILLPSKLNDKNDSKTKLKKSDFEKQLLKSVKENFNLYSELITKAEASGYDFNKFTQELDKPVAVKAKTKSLTKTRKKT
jgi:hypothetical protein